MTVPQQCLRATSSVQTCTAHAVVTRTPRAVTFGWRLLKVCVTSTTSQEQSNARVA